MSGCIWRTLNKKDQNTKLSHIDTFASNGHTSADMLREKYLYHIEREKTATEARKKIKPSSCALIKRSSVKE